MKALILTAAAGDGHISASRAIEAALVRMGAEARTVDALNCAPRAFRLWFTGGYETLVRRWPWFWGALYRWSDRPGLAYAFQTLLDDRMLVGLASLIEAERPNCIVCTQALPLPRLARLTGPAADVPVAVVITDLHPHRMWLRGRADRYFVPTEASRDRLAERLPGSSARTEVTGIPIHEAFTLDMPKEEARRVLNLGASARVVALTSGGIGGGPLTGVLEALCRVDEADHILVVCGRNVKASSQCARFAANLPDLMRDRVAVLGYLPQARFAMLLRAADIVVGKPGGLTMSECMALGKPTVICGELLIPGQEEQNAEHMVACGCGIIARDRPSLAGAVHALLADQARLDAMAAAALAHARPHAACTIAAHLVAMYGSESEAGQP